MEEQEFDDAELYNLLKANVEKGGKLIQLIQEMVNIPEGVSQKGEELLSKQKTSLEAPIVSLQASIKEVLEKSIDIDPDARKFMEDFRQEMRGLKSWRSFWVNLICITFGVMGLLAAIWGYNVKKDAIKEIEMGGIYKVLDLFEYNGIKSAAEDREVFEAFINDPDAKKTKKKYEAFRDKYKNEHGMD